MEVTTSQQQREAAVQKEYRFDTADDLLDFVNHGYNDGRFWQGIGKEKETLTYSQLRESAIKCLSDEFKNEGFDKETLDSWCETALKQAQKLYDQAVTWASEKPVEGLAATAYHGAGTGEGHIEMVMTNALLTTLALKRAVKSFDVLTPQQQRMINNRFWGKETINKIAPADIKKIIAYCVFHEAGEWWPRMVPFKKLPDYRRQLESSLKSFFENDPENSLILKDWVIKTRKEIKDETGTVTGYDLVNEYKIGQESPFFTEDIPSAGFINIEGTRSWVETFFRISLYEESDEKDISFNSELVRPAKDDEDKKRIALAQITRAADLMQSQDINYRQKVTVGNQQTTLGAAFLYAEFLRYMPHALPSYGWTKGILSASTNPFFVDVILEKLNLPSTLIQLLDQFVIDRGHPRFKGVCAKSRESLRTLAGLA